MSIILVCEIELEPLPLIGLCDMNDTICSVCCFRRAPSQVGYIYNQRRIYKTIFFV